MARRTLAIVRPFKPNLSEVSLYRRLLDDFAITYFYTGIEESTCRKQLDSLGLDRIQARRYRCYTDLISWPSLQRALDFKVGFGSVMLSKISEVMDHDVINIVDPLYFHTAQIHRRLRPGQQLDIVRWENLPSRYEQVWRASLDWQEILERGDHIICVSDASLYTLPAKLSAKAKRIYPGIDIKPHSEERNSAVLKVLFVGREQWTKGAEFAYWAVKILREKFTVDAQLIVVGSASQSFQSGAPAWLSSKGTLPIDQVRRLMASCDVLCFPSLVSRTWTEQFGFVLVEAMAQALPVVAFDSGCIREVCGPEGRYASVGNVHSLARELAVIAAADRDSIGARLQCRCRDLFDAEKQGEELLRFIS